MRVDVGGGVRLFFDVVGAGLVPDGDVMRARPTLVLLHGGPGFDHSTFKPAFEPFADIAQVVMVDHRGQGRSDGWDDPDSWDLDTWADDVRDLCDALGIEKPIVLGNSFGGMVAMHYGARHPEHPGGLVLSSTATHMDLDLIAGWFEKLGGPEAAAMARTFWTSPTMANTTEYLRICGPHYTQNEGNLFDDKRAVRNQAVLEKFVNEIQPTMDLRGDPPKLRCPTLLLAGALDPVCPIEVMTGIADAVPADLRQFEVFESCGHGVFRDDPDRAVAVLRDFILRVGG
jgi:pimeloyl-ACP methyl ester carboxylesterase